MAYNEYLAERIEQILKRKNIPFEEKKMFGGICYMVDDKMCIGIVQDQLMARVGPNMYESLLTEKGAAPMTFTGKTMSGFIYVNDDGWDTDEDLSFWVDQCLEYNPQAKKSKRKKK